MTRCRPPAARGRRVAAVVVLVVAALAGCAPTVCPAVGWSDVLTVTLADGWPTAGRRLADGWPAGAGRTVHLACSEPCGASSLTSGEQERETSLPLTGTLTSSGVVMTLPGSVAVRVVDRDGTELSRVEAQPEWVRVGGTEERGGPHEATVTVPAP